MSNPELEQLLSRVDDGTATEAELERLAMLLASEEQGWEPLPLEQDVDVEIADSVMSALALSEPELSAGVRGEAGEIELAHQVAPMPLDGQVASAVSRTAGSVELAAEVAPVPLLDEVPLAVRGEAGEVELARQVAPLPRIDAVGDAVRASAGQVELADALAPLPLSSELAAAVRQASGEVELADQLAPWPLSAAIREAVQAHAGTVALTDEVALVTAPEALSAMLDHELDDQTHRRLARRLMSDKTMSRQLTAWAGIGASLRAELAEEAEDAPYLWPAVAEAIGVEEPERVPGYDGALVAAAVRDAAGSVDIAREVMRTARAVEVLPASVVEVEEAPAPANRSLGLLSGLLAVALVMLTVVQVMQPFGSSTEPGLSAVPIQFASAGEIVIDDVSADAGMVQVYMSEDEPVIIWVDEEAL